MINSQTLQSLLEPSQIFYLATENLDLIEIDTENVLNFESGLVDLVLDVCDAENPDLPIEKLKKFSLVEVIHYLQASHKMYVSKTLPEIEQSMAFIQRRYEDTPEILKALTVFFDHYKVNFLEHIRMEEREFFSYLRKLHVAFVENMQGEDLSVFLENNSINKFIDDHDSIEDELKVVSEVIHKYSDGLTVSMPFKVFINQVEMFETDLRKHAIIEDYVLVPLAQFVERELQKRL